MQLSRTERIEIRRRRAGITKKALAALAGMSRVYGEALINGREYSDTGLGKLEAALDRAERAQTKEAA